MSKHMLPFHDHPLTYTEEFSTFCILCGEGKIEGGIVYHCTECDFSLHEECIERFLNHPFICNHFLKILGDSSVDKRNDPCHFCQSVTLFEIARCTVCNISMDLFCLADSPPLNVYQPKHHKHSFTLLVRLVNFTCNACGWEGDRNPYVCLECNLMLHTRCVDLPRVIIINRHDHRISHTFHLGQGDWECGVCQKMIEPFYGAYTCSCCPSYAVHSKCATRKEVWDGIELEDVPEEEEDIEDPFKVINDQDIIHFSHDKHILRVDENCFTDNDNMRCGGCVLPINVDPCYKCVECDFILHKACASLQRKKRNLLHNHPLTLWADEAYIFQCLACGTYCNGFRYECSYQDRCGRRNLFYDVRCSSISEPFHHYLHPHPLYWTLESNRCKACDIEVDDLLSCMDCEYALCIKCATLPKKVKHGCDDHFLSLCHDAGCSSGDLWCDICETKTDPSVCYYTCDECGLSLHINCVLGDFYYLKVGHVPNTDLEVLPNNGATRPFCSYCNVRCKSPLMMKGSSEEEDARYFCSLECAGIE